MVGNLSVVSGFFYRVILMTIYGYEEIEKNVIAIDIGKLFLDSWNINLIEDNNCRLHIMTRVDGIMTMFYNFILNRLSNYHNIIDHINNDPLDNRKINLREVSRKQNSYNSRKSIGKSSIYKGVCWNKKQSNWCYNIKYDGLKESGYCKNEEEAALEYDKLAKKYYGEYAYLNFPDKDKKRFNKQKPIYKENENSIIEIDFGKLIIDKEDLERVLSKNWYIYFICRKKRISNCIIKNKDKTKIVDHIDNNTLNNLETNLRLVSYQQNSFNKNCHINSKSSFKGVIYNKRINKWHSCISYNGKKHYLGVSENKEAAARKYDEFAKKFFGEYAKLNFPDLK